VNAPTNAAVLQLSGIAKTYGKVVALSNASLTIRETGSVHGLIGQNGSGKSTLLGILSGQIRADSGSFELDGHPRNFSAPAEAIQHGIVMVSQETALAPQLTVAENIFMGGRFARGPLGIDWNRTNDAASEVLHRLDLEVDPQALVATLAPDRQQMIEIARAISMRAKVLVLDEPTSSLEEDEVHALFAAIESVKAAGVSVIFVSHRLPELFAIADELTVLRDGQTVVTGAASTFTPESVVRAMVGRPVVAARRGSGAAGSPAVAPTLLVDRVNVANLLHDVSFIAAPGEIVGVAGLTGSGRSELLETIFGARAVDSGVVAIDGNDSGAVSPRASIRRGMGYLPPDRKAGGLVLTQTIQDNMAVVATLLTNRLAPHTSRAIADAVAKAMEWMTVRAASSDVLVHTLSGGNQQKVAIGKWIVAKSRILLLDEPTRGVDVAAKQEIYGLLHAAAASGTTIVVSSSENQELLDLCSRILVMYHGRLVANLVASEVDADRISLISGGAGL